MELQEPSHYLKICVSRELTDREFDDITDIIDENIGSVVSSDDVLENPNTDGMMCYVFQLWRDIADCDEGPEALDMLGFEIDQIIPKKLHWTIELSAPDIELEDDNE